MVYGSGGGGDSDGDVRGGGVGCDWCVTTLSLSSGCNYGKDLRKEKGK